MKMPKILCAVLLLFTFAACQSGASSQWERWDADSARGKPTKKLDLRWTANALADDAGLEAGTLTATVNRVVTEAKRGKIIVTFDLYNGLSEHVHFALRDAVLDYQGRAIVAKDGELWRQDPQPDVAPGATKKKVWAFEIGEMAKAGIYPLTISNLKTGGATSGDKDLLSEWQIDIKVPGALPPAADGM